MKVFVTRQIPQKAIDMLVEGGFDVILYAKEKPLNSIELIKLAKDADGILSMLSDKFDEDVIISLKKCKVIANYAVGYNNIDLSAAKKHNIIVTNTPDILTDATADIAFSLILCCARRIIDGHNMMIKNKFKGWQPKMFLGIELRGKTLGIIGAGRIGTAVAERAKAFGMNIIYFSRNKNENIEKNLNAKKVNLEKLLKNSDIISIHIPLSEDTFHLINSNNLKFLKPTTILINTARGEIVEEKALIKILQEHKIFAAGFDVYENEPDINKNLFNLDNVVLLPHIGSATFDARTKMAELAAKNIINVLKNKKPLTQVM